jgi:hypothetical protein
LDLPDVSALHIKRQTRLEQITARKLLKHRVIVLGVVAGDVPDLKSPKLVV